MKTILEIGHQYFLLPASANINAIIAVLGKATALAWITSAAGEDRYKPSGTAPRIQIKMVADNQVIDPIKPKQIAAEASPDAHNTFGGELPLVVRKVVNRKEADASGKETKGSP